MMISHKISSVLTHFKHNFVVSFFKTIGFLALICIFFLSCETGDVDDVKDNIAVDSVVVITNQITGITTNSATGGGGIEKVSGNVVILQKGICWQESNYYEPDLMDYFTNEGSGFGTFTSQLTDLEFDKYSGKIYDVRAYAITDKDTVFGEEVTFQTLTPDSEIPILELSGKESLDGMSFTFGGSIIYPGSASVNKRGICWGYFPEPTSNSESNFFTYQDRLYTPDNWEEEISPDEDIFWATIDLEPNTTYYFRAYASNVNGTGYSETYEVTTSSQGTVFIEGSGVVDIDGNQYRTVIINNQEWMAQNLRVTTYANGEPIINSSNLEEWEVNDQNSTGTYTYLSHPLFQEGALYNLYAAQDQRKLCPNGWHLPTTVEWASLVKYLDPEATVYPDNSFESSSAAAKLLSTNQYSFDDCYYDEGRTNISGFTAYHVSHINYVPPLYGSSGDNGYYEIYSSCPSVTFWWSDSDNPGSIHMEGRAYMMSVDNRTNGGDGGCIRCIKD